DVDDQERERDGKDRIAKGLEPCVRVRVCHVVVAVSVYAVDDPVAILSSVAARCPRNLPSGHQASYRISERAKSGWLFRRFPQLVDRGSLREALPFTFSASLFA